MRRLLLLLAGQVVAVKEIDSSGAGAGHARLARRADLTRHRVREVSL